MDRISQLPEHIILYHILPCLPIKDGGRTSILSKTWKNLSSTYNISSSLILDHNFFALAELLHSANCEPTVYDISDRFMDFAEALLLTMNHDKSAVLKLEIDIAVIDGDFSRVHQLMDLVRNTKVEELTIFVQTRDFIYVELNQTYECYDIPYFILTKPWLRSLTLRWCKLMGQSLPTDAGLVAQLGTLCSLRELHLSEVLLSDEDSLNNLASCCPRIEVIMIDCCTFWFETLKLSKLPQLKKASFEDMRYWLLRSVDLAETKLESFHCSTDLECTISSASCSNIRKIHLNDCTINEPHLFKDLTTTFPLLEEAEILTRLEGVDRIKASNHPMTKLKLLVNFTENEIYVDAPNLEVFEYLGGADVKELYVDCPNLRQLRYWRGKKFPKLSRTNAPILILMSLDEKVVHPIETSWFTSLSRKVLKQRTVYEVDFNLDEFGAIWNPKQKTVYLEVQIKYEGNINRISGALIDGLIWSTCPSTLTIIGDCYSFVEHVKEKLALKAQKESCCELSLCNKYWWHNIRDFRFASYSLSSCFRFQWLST